MNNKTISEKSGLSPCEVTRILNYSKYGRKVTWRQAVKLSQAFGRTITYWRGISPSKLRRVLDAIK